MRVKPKKQTINQTEYAPALPFGERPNDYHSLVPSKTSSIGLSPISTRRAVNEYYKRV